MRPDPDQSFYTITDLQDQPEARYALFITIGGVPSTFQVDGVRWTDARDFGGTGLEAYRGDTVVLRFDNRTSWSMVARTHVELVTKTQQREHYIAGLAIQLRYDVRCSRLMKEARAAAQQSDDDYVGGQMGEGWGEKL